VNTNSFTGFPVIGLIGGIGSGKSAVARSLAARQNYTLVDADSLGHEVLKQADVIQQIKKRFGENVLNERDEIDRSQLARRVFGTDAVSNIAREDLNRIVHPGIGAKIQQQIQQAFESAEREPGRVQGILLDAAILLETGWAEFCDAIVFVDASPEVRENRVRETRGWTQADWKKREDSQLSLEHKKNAAHAIINNSQNLDLAVDELEQFLASQFFAGKPS
jgi:dephospho-CoA kinase